MTIANIAFRQFRSALLALIPIMGEAGVGWRDDEQYDSFDALADGLFQAFLIDHLEEDPKVHRSMLGYRYDISPYASSEGSYFIVTAEKGKGKFMRLSFNLEPFDTVHYEVEGKMALAPFETCEFSF
jgi:hypothetical protein